MELECFLEEAFTAITEIATVVDLNTLSQPATKSLKRLFKTLEEP